jgi:hypothetical protein
LTAFGFDDPAFLAAASAAVFDPLSLSPALWLDASDAATITHTGGLVDQWNDKSGNARHVTSSSTNRPQTGVDTINGRNVLTFDGSNDWMLSGSVTISQPTTAVAVVKSASTTSTVSILNSGPSATTQALFISGGSGARLLRLFSGSATAGISITDTQANVVAGFFSGASSYQAVNGTKSANQNAGTQSLGAGWRIGANRDANGEFWRGQIAEILFFPSGLSDANRQAVEAYLKTKWGTP